MDPDVDTNLKGDSDTANGEVGENSATGGGASVVDGCSLNKQAKKKSKCVMVVPKEATRYKMDHKYRGYAVIFNHENFMDGRHDRRNGTHKDANDLTDQLTALGFNVRRYNDKTSEQIKYILEKMSYKDHRDNDCFLLAVLSHGSDGLVEAYDYPYRTDELWLPFTADKCPTLAGKPKLFFIQACRGKQLDPGVTLYKPVQTDSQSSYKIPIFADFLIAYSTIPGFYSWRNAARGSWFIQALCKELSKRELELEICTLLTNVNRTVATEYESSDLKDEMFNNQKEMPCFYSTLIRSLIFYPIEIQSVANKSSNHSPSEPTAQSEDKK